MPPGLFQEKLGRTNLVEHQIPVKDKKPVRQRLYRIPQSLMPRLREEVELIRSLGIIETYRSEWCNPVVLVPKKDGSMQFCIDFRVIHGLAKFDP